ncbi:hypothetical protein BDN72DRAFT_873605 [Pluteus cervinus]|uniref:Uncharacterized protein n=1 Tax=Pluteus cervinus TaxID=181527 RepID=A0ACD3BHB4_9AGAR|nr:hypothetical protein BDN72DRAFT_873605 [Pluteus cervinus]
MRLAISVGRPNLVSLGTCFGKFSKSGKFKLHITSLDYLAQYAKYKIWIKPNGEMPFLYGNHIVKAHLGRITEDTPEHQGVVVYSMADIPLGFGVTARSTVDTRKLDPTAIIVFHQSDVGEYLRDEGHGDSENGSGLSGFSRTEAQSEFGMASTSTNPSTDWSNLADDELTAETIRSILQSIPDDLWTVAACADRFVDDFTTQKALLEYGISRTNSTIERCKDVLNTVESDDEDDSSEYSGSSSSDSKYTRLRSYLAASPHEARICRLRSILVKHLDLLNTYVEMCKAASDNDDDDQDTDIDEWEDPWSTSAASSKAKARADLPFSLSVFLRAHVVDSACHLAALQRFHELDVLLRRHGDLTWPYRFKVLDSTPEHTHPSQFLRLLPSVDSSRNMEHIHNMVPWRRTPDWVEEPEIASLLTSFANEEDEYLPEEDKQNDLLSPEDLTEWYKERVERIGNETGMIDIALSLVQHAASQGIPGLDELGEELSLLSRLVYDTHQDENSTVQDWTLSQWVSMKPQAVIEAYLTNSSLESLADDISRLVMPYLYVLEARAERAGNPDNNLAAHLLYDHILSAPLSRVAIILEASKPTLPPSRRLVKSDEDVARLALACLYGSKILDQWPTMSSIFECMPVWDNSDDEDEDEDAADTTLSALADFVVPSTTRPQCTPDDLFSFFKPLPISALSRILDVLDVQLESGEILARWSVAAPLQWFLRSNTKISEQRAWANRMARRAGGLQDRLQGEEDWEWLFEDMLKLCGSGENRSRSAFGLLSREEVVCIYFSGILSAGSFEIAQKLLYSPKSKLKLDPTTVEEICLTSSQEFYDNASSGNFNSGEMKLAYECLRVSPPTDRINKAREFIEATSKLTSYNLTSRRGIPLSPIEIRQTKDKLSLVSQVLSSNNDAYKHTEVIMDLVNRLGFRDDIVAEVKVLSMLADTALQHEDLERAYEISQSMVNTVLNLRESEATGNPLASTPAIAEASEVCWVACYQLGRQPEFTDLDKKMSLIGRALELCPADKLHDVLISWRRFQQEDIEARKERLENNRGESPTAKGGAGPSMGISSLKSRLQGFQLPTSPLLNTPDAAALASRTLRSVAANFPFSVSGSRSHPDEQHARSESPMRPETDVSAQASKVISKGIGWLIGAD